MKPNKSNSPVLRSRKIWLSLWRNASNLVDNSVTAPYPLPTHCNVAPYLLVNYFVDRFYSSCSTSDVSNVNISWTDSLWSTFNAPITVPSAEMKFIPRREAVFKAVIRPFENLKMFYPPKDLCEAEPNRVHLFLSILCLRKGVGPFVTRAVIRLFEVLKMLYPPKGLFKAEHKGSIRQSFHFIVRKGPLDLSIHRR